MESSPYHAHVLRDATVTEVQPDARRLFLVVSGTRSLTGRPWTLVLEQENDYWISRRELDGLYSPAEAVSGFLFDREGYQDPVEMLRRMNDTFRTEYYRVLQEKIRSDQARVELAGELARARDPAEPPGRRRRRPAGRMRRTAAARRRRSR